MKYLPRMIAAILMTYGLAVTPQRVCAQEEGFESQHPPIAVVELFTSEGCADCPEADALLAQFDMDGRVMRRRIYPLAFHVDYWNRLGWTDRYSKPENTARQMEYTQALRVTRAYTPQMIVNGRAQFPGTDQERAKKEIELALSKPAAATVAMKLRMSNQGKTVTASYVVTDASTDAVLCVALVQRGVVSKVERGENAGRILKHEAMVRAFKTQSLLRGPAGRVTFHIPRGIDLSTASLVAFVQNPATMAILGATAEDLPKGE